MNSKNLPSTYFVLILKTALWRIHKFKTYNFKRFKTATIKLLLSLLVPQNGYVMPIDNTNKRNLKHKNELDKKMCMVSGYILVYSFVFYFLIWIMVKIVTKKHKVSLHNHLKNKK